jgi:chemosensory pili system protein ChpA (sensor histidine kinase/response regulator)
MSPNERVLSVLFIDDDVGILDAFGRYLEMSGLRVTLATNPLEAIARVGAITPDVIVLDVAMPGVDGFTVVDTLRARPEAAHIPIVILTGLPIERLCRDHVGQDRRISACVQKPCSPDELLDVVRAIKTAAATVEGDR